MSPPSNAAAIDPLPWLHAHGITFYGKATGDVAQSTAHAED